MVFFNCFYFPLFGLFATVGIYFPALKNEAGAIQQGWYEKYARQRRGRFYGSLAITVGIGMIGTADLPLQKNRILHRAHRWDCWNRYKRMTWL